MKRLGFLLVLLLVAAIMLIALTGPGQELVSNLLEQFNKQIVYHVDEIEYPLDNKLIEQKNRLNIPVVSIPSDKDGDGILDLADFIEGARLDAQNKPSYKDAYYSGGYPPDDEGVCTDVIWRAFKNAGYSLKDLIDEDIQNNTGLYPRVNNKPDPNIDFRRVQNLIVFFNRYAEVLTTELIPGDKENLALWQGGDIVIFIEPYEHIGILSDIRDKDGVPYLIHNGGPYTKEENILTWYLSEGHEVAWHFRFPKQQ